MRKRGANGGQIPLTDLNSVTVPGLFHSCLRLYDE